jgi:hypothetical protein
MINSNIPIILQLKRLPSARSNQTRSITTSPAFFQRVLNLNPGEPFQLDFQKWLALKQCGLFTNLTARTVVTTDNLGNESVSLEVMGIENPSLSIAPELGFSLSLTRPEISGGVSCNRHRLL